MSSAEHSSEPRLRATGMSSRDMQRFAELRRHGDTTISEHRG